MKSIKKFVSVVLCVCILMSGIGAFALAENSMHTSAKTPVSASTAVLKWQLKLGTSYVNAPSVPTVVGDTLLVMSGNKLYKLDSEDGSVIKSVDMVEKPNYGYTPVTYSDGVIYCPLNNGTVQAFNYKTMKSIWVYKDELGGQSLTPITCSDGFVYTGFWNGEEEYADYVCINAKDENKLKTDEEKSAVWTYKSKGGFYWAGCAVAGDKIIFGGDDGTAYSDKNSQLRCLNKATGEVSDTLSIVGDQRSTVVYDSGKIYASTKAGFLYSVSLGSDGKFEDSSLKKLKLSGATTATPVIYNNRLYLGAQGNGFGSGKLEVINATTLKSVYSVPVKGYPQTAVLVSDGYYSDSGKVYIYTTYNAAPGGITVITDCEGQTSAKVSELFTPNSESGAYSVSTISADENGTLYYKNDLGNIFAVENTENKSEENNDSWIARIFKAIVNFFKNLFV